MLARLYSTAAKGHPDPSWPHYLLSLVCPRPFVFKPANNFTIVVIVDRVIQSSFPFRRLEMSLCTGL